MRILSTEYITMYNINHDGNEYIRQVVTNIKGQIEDPLWMQNTNGLLDIVVDKKILQELEKEFDQNIH